MNEVVSRLKEFLEVDARSCSMDFGCVTPLYAFRIFGSQYSYEEVATELKELQKQRLMNLG